MSKVKQNEVMRAVTAELLGAAGKTKTILASESNFSAVEMAGSMQEAMALASNALEKVKITSESHAAAVEMAGAMALYFDAKAKEFETKGLGDKQMKASDMLKEMFSGTI